VADPSGFTLLEVMIALAILAVALAAVIGLQSRTVSLDVETRFNSVAPFLAQARMTETLAAGEDAPSEDSGDFGEDFPGYEWTVSMERVDLPGLGEISRRVRRVEVTVSFAGDVGLVYRLRRYRYRQEGA
jgi:general secretion pathway protein I